ncbi:MAG: rhomboid family intramembrane serine protease [Bacteroidales bacterium]|nr:rhomboid family intramembrane serine protease [Bacteroidales bacterium]
MTQQQYQVGRFNVLPPVVKNLLIINVLFYLATFTFERFGIDLVDKLGLHFFISEHFRFYQIFTYMFMHGSFAHIFFNMFALWMFGSAIENIWGSKRFLIYYLVTGIGAAVLHYIVFYLEYLPTLQAIDAFIDNPDVQSFINFMQGEVFKVVSNDVAQSANLVISDFNSLVNINSTEALQIATDFMRQYRVDLLNAPVIVGASGAVFGLLLAFGMMFPNSYVYIYFAIPMKAKWFVVLYGAIELISGFSNISGDSVAHFAHLGGMLFGYLLIVYWRKKGWF